MTLKRPFLRLIERETVAHHLPSAQCSHRFPRCSAVSKHPPFPELSAALLHQAISGSDNRHPALHSPGKTGTGTGQPRKGITDRTRLACFGRGRCLESLPILWSDPVRVRPGRPAALPTAVGWDEELRGPDRRCTTTTAGALRVIV